MREFVLIAALLFATPVQTGDSLRSADPSECFYNIDELFGPDRARFIMRSFRCEMAKHPSLRMKFDKAAQKVMLDPDCECLRFLRKGLIETMPYPLNEADRASLYDGIRREIITPIRGRRKS